MQWASLSLHDSPCRAKAKKKAFTKYNKKHSDGR